jgi:hypothetical protein
MVTTPVEVCDLFVWGAYFSTDSAAPDDFTLIVHRHTAGLPGAVVHTESGIASTRTLTGNQFIGLSEYLYRLVPASPLPLDPGRYWIELFNDTGAGTDDWVWEQGNLDGSSGFSDCAFDTAAPGNAWQPTSDDMSLVVRARERGLGTKHCVANVNSSGSPADIVASGSTSSSAGNLTLTSSPVPNQSSVFFHGASAIQTPFGNGFLCTAGSLRRGSVVSASGNSATTTYDNSGPKLSLQAFIGQTRHFQHWFRDPMGAGTNFSTSNAVALDITP